MTVSKLTKSTDVYEVQQKINEIIDSYPTVRGYLENGQLYSDATLYNDVYSYNYSTFDLSKFTVAGTPIITDDGIASVTANGNMTHRVSIPFTFDLTAKKWSIISNFTTGSSVDAGYTIGSWRTNDSVNCYHVGSYVFSFSIYVNVDGTRTQVGSGNTSLPNLVQYRTNTKYVQIVSRNNNTYTYTIYNVSNPSETGTITITSEYDLYNANVLCVYSNASSSSFKSCNLKEVKVVVNDYPIFSGTKTDIDTTKPVDYTEVGTGLTITNDGIASGFSASSYLTKITTITLDKTTYFELDVKFKTPTSWTKNGRFWGYGTKLYFGHTAIGKLSGAFLSSAINQDSISILATNTTYEAKYVYDATGFYVKFKKVNENTWTTSTPATVTSTETQTLRGAIGNAYTDTTAYYTGSIDLNSIKFYVNGDLVYQPCLLIPYNESSTGSKVVDVAYRDRVIDVYNQYGSANYYTIDETNKNVTLPMGEIYGFIEQVNEQAKENFSVPAYGNQDIGIIIADDFTYTCPDNGYIYCNNILIAPGGGFDLSISRNGQSSSLISFGGISVETLVEIPFIFPVLKDDEVQILRSSVTETYPILYFVPKKGV